MATQRISRRIVESCIFRSLLIFALQHVIFFQSAAQEIAKEHYSSGVLKETGLRVNQQKEGEWVFYYPTGKKNVIEHYHLGKLDGLVTYYFSNEVVQAVETWQNGTLQDSAWYYHENGKIHRSGKYRNSQYEGLWKYWFDNGMLERLIRYAEGLPDGPTQAFDEHGRLVQEGNYQHGKESGEWKFYKEGILEFSGRYENGKEVGTWLQYRNGKSKVYKNY